MLAIISAIDGAASSDIQKKYSDAVLRVFCGLFFVHALLTTWAVLRSRVYAQILQYN